VKNDKVEKFRNLPGLALLALLALAAQAPAQPGSSPTSQAPVFKYYVWGQVRSPGAISLGGNPDLMELLSAAGGPTEYADVMHVVLIRATTQQRMKVNLKKMLYAGQVVPLSPGDVVMVPNSPWYRIREGFSIVTTVTSMATLVLVIMNGVGK
jgi:protein involved in polysaccharide export with SLBB domain